MSDGDRRDDQGDEEDGDRLRGTTTTNAVPVEFVSAFAGDRAMTETERARLRDLRTRRGKVFYSDLLYAISHQYFAPEIAESIWNRVLSHKFMMSETLGRNVRVTVATLDYLSNITGEMKSFTLMAEASVAEIVNLSMRDGMTGLYNHSTCYELLELEFRNYRRYGVVVGLILLDIDDFKRVNDGYGHPEGDKVLVELATTLRRGTRESDICCRFGGEEFAVILPLTNDRREAFEIAERIRIDTTKIACHGLEITVSAGVALSDGNAHTSVALVAEADRALYEAKSKGKNNVVVSEAS